jgi:hypothetical protein
VLRTVLMDSDKRSAQVERLAPEVFEPIGRQLGSQPERRCTPTIAAAGNNSDKRLSAIDRLWPLSIRPPHRVRQINHLGTLGTDHGTQLVNHRLQGGDFDPQRSDFLGKLTLHRLAFVGYLLGHRR